jgi:glycosyltransferase involved in cell wall biosynthesis
MTIHFIAGKFSERRASHRLRGKLISESLTAEGIESFYGSNLAQVNSGDIVVFLKTANVEHINIAKSKGAITIYDICDNKLDEDEVYLPCAIQADYVTCNSNIMAREIKEVANKRAIVIPDPYERPRRSVNFNPGNIVRLVWFGSQSSLGYVNWPAIWQRLEIRLGDYRLDIVSGKADRFQNKSEHRSRNLVDFPEYANINFNKIRFHEWSWDTQQQCIDEADIVFMPIDVDHERTITKSANRVIDSLISGKFVITNMLESYQEFGPYIWTKDWLKGINWSLIHRAQVNEMILAGQQYVELNYSVDKIMFKWIDLFKTLNYDFTRRS